MPWRAILEYPSFFGSIFGALVGGGIVWGTTVQMIRQLKTNDERQDEVLEHHTEKLEAIREYQKDFMSKSDCEREQNQCHKYLCRKIEELIDHTKSLQERSESNKIVITEIRQQLKAIEARMDWESRTGRNSG